MPVTVEEVRTVALALPRTTEALVRDTVRFRVGQLVYLGFSRDERVMGWTMVVPKRVAATVVGEGT